MFQVRPMVELVLKIAQDDLRLTNPELISFVKSYRGGYNKSDRRKLEKAFFGGQVSMDLVLISLCDCCRSLG
jgi:ATP-dependent helicase YprA (DUF1998 family)